MKRSYSSAIAGLCVCAAIASLVRAAEDGPPPKTLPPDVLPGAAFIPTPHDVVARMLELSAVTKDDVVYDLGCGDGRIVVAAARRYGCRAVGVDIDPMRVEESRESVEKNRVGHLVRIEQGDLYEVDFAEASVVTLYLGSTFNQRLLPQLRQLKPGSRIVSHQFGIPGIKPQKIIRVRSSEDPHVHALLLWTTPLERPE